MFWRCGDAGQRRGRRRKGKKRHTHRPGRESYWTERAGKECRQVSGGTAVPLTASDFRSTPHLYPNIIAGVAGPAHRRTGRQPTLARGGVLIAYFSAESRVDLPDGRRALLSASLACQPTLPPLPIIARVDLPDGQRALLSDPPTLISVPQSGNHFWWKSSLVFSVLFRVDSHFF